MKSRIGKLRFTRKLAEAILGLPIMINCPKFSHHQIPIEASVLNGLTDMFRSNISTAGLVRNRPSELECEIIRTCRESELRSRDLSKYNRKDAKKNVKDAK